MTVLKVRVGAKCGFRVQRCGRSRVLRCYGDMGGVQRSPGSGSLILVISCTSSTLDCNIRFYPHKEDIKQQVAFVA